MEQFAKILLAAQEISLGLDPSVELTKAELAYALELAEKYYCPGCG